MKKSSLILTVFAALAIVLLLVVSLAFGKDKAEPASGDELTSEDIQHQSESPSGSEEGPSSPDIASSGEPESSDETLPPESSAVIPEESSSAPVGPGEEESSEPAEESSAPVEESSEETSVPALTEDRVVHFLACPDNIIHPSVYYDALELAAKKAVRQNRTELNLQDAQAIR